MKVTKTLFLSVVAVILIAGIATSNDYVPGKPQTVPILLKGGTLFTVSDGVLENTDLLFENGRITAIGMNLEAPA